MTMNSRTLTVIRHAKSSWKLPVSDFERPLNKRGRRNAEELGTWLASQPLQFDRVLCSPARRTMETIEIIANKMRLPETIIEPVDAIYLASARTLLDLLRSQDNDLEHIALVGHNPGVSSLVHDLVARSFHQDLRTCAIVQMQFDIPSWQDISPHQGRLLFHRDPKLAQLADHQTE